MNDPIQEIERLRREVDRLDTRILQAINERATVVTDIGKVKSLTNIPVYQPTREAQVIDNMIAAEYRSDARYGYRGYLCSNHGLGTPA